MKNLKTKWRLWLAALVIFFACQVMGNSSSDSTAHIIGPFTNGNADPILHIGRKVSNHCLDQPAIFIDGFNGDCNGSRAIAIKIQDTNHFIWSPYDRLGNEFGMFWATNDHAIWDSGQYSSNPNEIVFVGYGEKKAAISLRNGNAYFNAIKAYKLTLDQNRWADFVFEDDYELMPLNDVEKYIADKGHLPGIPSAEEVAANGISIGDTQIQLLQKIEELTLHLIKQNKEIVSLKESVKMLRQQLSASK